MKDKSLYLTLRMILLHLKELGIDDTDKLELMINIKKFLDSDYYEENVKNLSKSFKKG